MTSKKQNTDLYVLGATSISQYKLPDFTSDDKQKILTVIGESHRLDFSTYECPAPNISVPDYIEKISKENNLMLEIPPGSLNSGFYMSTNLNTVLNKVISNETDMIVTGIDIRPILIEPECLYNNDSKLNNVKMLDLMTYYYMKMPTSIEYLHKHISNDKLHMRQKRYLQKFLDQLQQEYQLVKIKFEPHIAKVVRKDENTTVKDYFATSPQPVKGISAKGVMFEYTLIDVLRIFWMKVTDFMVIYNLYMSNEQHNILLIGNHHAENIDTIMFNYRIFPSPYKPLQSRIKHCTNVRGTFLYTD